MSFLDAHVHIWTHDPAWPFAPEEISPPTRPAEPDELLALMEANGVEGAVLVQPIQYRWDNRYLAAVRRAHPRRFAAVCRVDPVDPAAPDHLRRWVEEEGFRGVRISPGPDPSGDWFDGPFMDPLFARAASLGVPLLLLTKPPRLPRLSALLDRHPGLDVCVDHMADVSPTDAAGIVTLLELARHPRVRVKISHGWSLSRKPFPWRDTWELLTRVRDAFGARRLMWCSDWPVSVPHAGYGETLRMLEGLFPPAELAWIRGDSAREWWPLDPAPN